MMGLANTTSKDFSWDFINFITQHPLIEGSITPTLAPNGNSPQVTSQQMSRDKELFTKIAVQNVIDNSGVAHSVVFVGTKSGKVIKFITINQDTKPETLELMEVTWGNSPIDDLVLSEANNQLFVHTGGAVIQMSTTNCAAYSTSCDVCDACTMCVLSRDPMCGWDASIEQCVAMGGGTLLQNIESGTTRECGEIQSKIKRSKAPEIGSNEIVGRRVDSQSVIATWYKMFPNGSKLALLGQDRYRHLSDSRLEIDPFLPSDVTTFVCDYTLYDITVGRDQVIYSNDVTIPPVAVVTPTSIDGSTEEKSLGGVPPNGTPPNEETVGTPEPPAPREAGISPIVIVIVVVCIVIIILLVACVYHKRCRKPSYIGAKYQTNEKPPNP
uniref:Sema domain-containing protein n=1 Tax=Ciona savignyi TaxID=51511 RepID=H2Y5W4_CIOSA